LLFAVLLLMVPPHCAQSFVKVGHFPLPHCAQSFVKVGARAPGALYGVGAACALPRVVQKLSPYEWV